MVGYVGNFLGVLTIGIAIDVMRSYDSLFLICAGTATIGVVAIQKVKT